jgi:uroporphyrinogen decarboxylase
MMTHRERFFATIANEPVDRPASWLGLPAPSALPGLLSYFGVNSVDELKRCVNDDIYPIAVPYSHPPANHIAAAFDFAKTVAGLAPKERTLTAPGFFEGMEDPARIDEFHWPDPSGHMSVPQCSKAIDAAPEGYAVMGIMWSAHFQDACSAFGMENALMTMLTCPEMFDAVIERIVEFYLQANEIFYEAGKGKLDAVLIGNDFGSQTSLMVNPDLLRKHVFPGTKKLVDQAHSYGLKVLHHSCGSVFPVIGDLINLGVDSIHPIQAKATDMDARHLKKHFGGKTSFCGGVDAQHLLVNGTPHDVEKNVHELKQLFPTGLIISPSHEAVLPDIPPANIEALFNAVTQKQE